jgi:hypothetical protein
MTRIEVTRHVAADPTSVALLLAEPPSEEDGHHEVVVAPPRRAGVGFVSAIAVTGALGRSVAGQVTVEPASDAGCDVRIVLRAPDHTAARVIERASSTFLDVLSARARSRAYAA